MLSAIGVEPEAQLPFAGLHHANHDISPSPATKRQTIMNSTKAPVAFIHAKVAARIQDETERLTRTAA